MQDTTFNVSNNGANLRKKLLNGSRDGLLMGRDGFHSQLYIRKTPMKWAFLSSCAELQRFEPV
ncbi:MAG: hypothetical protein SOY63_00325 [Alloprevotella sp.]|nr:hypothetical protein [Alloprevotella sp.]